jgi:hypothetical protein
MSNTVVLISSIVGSLDQIKDRSAFPLSLATAACNLRPEFEIKMLDQRRNPNWKQELLIELVKKPICVCTTAMLGEQIKYALEICKFVKDNSDVPTVWGGSQGSIMPEITIKHSLIDYLIQGDGERALPNLVRAIANKQSVDGIAGIWTKQGNKIPYEQVKLDEQNEPIYDYYTKGQLFNYMPYRFEFPTIDVELSRGCPYKCRFCFNPYLHHSWRPLSLQRAKERVMRLHKKYDIDSFWFIDDEFFIDIDRAQSMIEFMYINILQWSIQGVTIRSVVNMDKDYLKLLKKSGCRQLNIGVESGSERILQMINKPIKVSEVLQVNQNLKEAEIIPSYYFIVGFPDERKTDFYDTLNLVSRLLKENPMAKIMNIGTYSPYPHSGLEPRCIELGYKPPQELEGYINYGVDNENLPWQIGNKDIIGSNWCNYFLDRKIDDLSIPLYMKGLFKLYQPVAKWRFNHKYFGVPVDIKLGIKAKGLVKR